MDIDAIKGILGMYLMAYRESCPQYSDIMVIPVENEDDYQKDPAVASLLAEGYELIDINAFGDKDGRTASAIILGKK